MDGHSPNFFHNKPGKLLQNYKKETDTKHMPLPAFTGAVVVAGITLTIWGVSSTSSSPQTVGVTGDVTATAQPSRFLVKEKPVTVRISPRMTVKVKAVKLSRSTRQSSISHESVVAYGDNLNFSLSPGMWKFTFVSKKIAGEVWKPEQVHVKAFIPAKSSVGYQKKYVVRYETASENGQTVLPTPRKPAPGANATPSHPYYTEILSLVNAQRAAGAVCGGKTQPPVGSVTYNGELEEAAQAHADDMAANNYFEHDNLQGETFVDRIGKTDYAGALGGENIAMGFATPTAVMEGWMNSPSHCENIMDEYWKEAGFGYASHKDPRYVTPLTYWVQEFAYG